MIFTLAWLLISAHAAETHSSTLRTLNSLFYSATTSEREHQELHLHETLPKIADFYARLELPELAYYYLRRAFEAAMVAEKSNRISLDAVGRLKQRVSDIRRETSALVSQRDEIQNADPARVAQLFLSIHNRVLDLSKDAEPLVFEDKIRRGFANAFFELGEPLDENTIAALFAVVTNVNYDSEVRLTALVYLGRTGRPELVPMLRHYAQDRHSSTDLARAALNALDRYDDGALKASLVRILDDGRAPGWARQLAAERLGNFDDDNTRAVLEAAVRRHLASDWPLGLAALQSLEKIGNDHTLEQMRRLLAGGVSGPRKVDAVKASVIALANRLRVDCDDLLRKKN